MDDAPIFDASLRVWSDSLPLRSIVEALGLPARHVHVKGEAIPGGHGRLAPRHYACLDQHEVPAPGEARLAGWLAEVTRRVADTPALAAALKSGDAQATAWIASFGPNASPLALPEATLTAARDAGLEVLVENLADAPAGQPGRSWPTRSLP